MNKTQKIIIAIAGLLIIAIMLFPPYTIKYKGIIISSGYKFLFAFSKISRSLDYSINITMLIIQSILVLVIAGIAFIFAKDNKNKKQNYSIYPEEQINKPIKNENEIAINREQELQNKNDVKTMPTKWLNFWIYFRLPVTAVFSFVWATSLKHNEIGIFLFCWSVFILVVAFGLYKRKLWAWKLLWLILVSDFLVCWQYRGVEFISSLIIVGFLWFVPNLSYFKRRKILFSK